MSDMCGIKYVALSGLGHVGFTLSSRYTGRYHILPLQGLLP